MIGDPEQTKNALALLGQIQQGLKALGMWDEAPAPVAPVPAQNKPKLNKREVTAIRAMSRSGETNRSIADIYQVNPATISRIVRGQYHK